MPGCRRFRLTGFRSGVVGMAHFGGSAVAFAPILPPAWIFLEAEHRP